MTYQHSRPPRFVLDNAPVYRRRRIALGIGAVAAIILVVGVIAWLNSGGASTDSSQVDPDIPEPVGPKLVYKGFKPSLIITDARMTNSSSMDDAQIQEFLDKVGKGCRPGETTGKKLACLKDYTTDAPSRKADAYCRKPYVGGKDRTAAQIIGETARSCNINPQVLLVMLQKEQSLLTASSFRLVPAKYDKATGYACPDNHKCNPEFSGFEKQVYYAARQLQRYRVDPGHYQFKAGRENTIKYSINEDCGSEKVYIDNWATAALYNYTPYIPNPDAMAGFADAPCSQVGNVNFYALHKAWFGDPTRDPAK